MQVCLFFKTALDADYTSLPLWRDHLIKESTSAIFSNRGIECWPIAREGFSGSHQGDVDGCMATLDVMMMMMMMMMIMMMMMVMMMMMMMMFFDVFQLHFHEDLIT